MIGHFDKALAFVWRPDNDGQGYHVTPGDRGGATSWGVTLKTFAAWRAAHGIRATSSADLRAATPAMLSPIYRAWYWAPVNGDGLPAGVDVMVFNFGVGSGPTTAAERLQRLLGMTGRDVDGDIGPETLQAVADYGPSLIDDVLADYQGFYRSLGQPEFLHGWLRRVNDCATLARTLASPT